MRIELATSSLPRKCSTTELQRLLDFGFRIFDFGSFAFRNQKSPTRHRAERETRLEPATYSLEGCRSTNWATPALISLFFFQRTLRLYAWIRRGGLPLSYSRILIFKELRNLSVGRRGFEPRNSEEDRFTVCCRWPLDYLPDCHHLHFTYEPKEGVEPPTYWLQISSSTNWATSAYFFHFFKKRKKKSRFRKRDAIIATYFYLTKP